MRQLLGYLLSVLLVVTLLITAYKAVFETTLPSVVKTSFDNLENARKRR